MSELPALPIWDVLNLNGISLVLTGYLLAMLEDVHWGDTRREEAWDELPPLSDPYAEI
ncbi:MAG: hypothetical protein P4L36_22460 [Holophaga sp.]|jgi:hypothetical protein|nr:hypothetical protein [Holophaga sp.]